jgi:Sec-independent protein translocase protein TatA
MPEILRQAGKIFGRLQRLANEFKREIEKSDDYPGKD